MKKAIYTIGANNKTGVLDMEQIEQICNAHFIGYTALEVIGYWKGKREKSCRVEVVTEMNSTELVRVAKELREKLQQESVLIEVVESNAAFIQ